MTEKAILSNLSDLIPIIIKKIITKAIIVEIKLYNNGVLELKSPKPIPVFHKRSRFKIDERILVDGTIFREIHLDVVDNYLDVIRKHQIKSVAIVLLHSYKNPLHEELLRNYILDKSPQLHISLSSEISPIIGEFDRLNTTCANAYIQPIAEKYLNDLNNHLCSLGIEKFRLIWSDGGLSSLKESVLTPIRLLESGPAGGALAVSSLSRSSSNTSCIAFDMGGTTAKICLLKDLKPGKATEFEFGRVHQNKPGSGIKVKVPSIHMLEIGALLLVLLLRYFRCDGQN